MNIAIENDRNEFEKDMLRGLVVICKRSTAARRLDTTPAMVAPEEAGDEIWCHMDPTTFTVMTSKAPGTGYEPNFQTLLYAGRTVFTSARHAAVLNETRLGGTSALRNKGIVGMVIDAGRGTLWLTNTDT